MDERSPRQSDSSGSPDASGESAAHEARPENPYRIPQRPSRVDPDRTGRFAGDHSYPYGAENPGSGGSSSLGAWDNPFRSPDAPEETVEAPSGGTAENDLGGFENLPEPDRPWYEQDIPSGTATSDFGVPNDEAPRVPRSDMGLTSSSGDGDNSFETHSGGQGGSYGATDHTPQTSWPTPEPPHPTPTESTNRTAPEDHTPYGDNTSETHSGGWENSYTDSTHGASEGGEGVTGGESSYAPGAPGVPSWQWDAPPEDVGTRTPSEAREGSPEETGHTWNEPSTDPATAEHSWSGLTSTGSWQSPTADQPHQDDHTYSSWQGDGTGSQETPRSWDEPDRPQPTPEWNPSSAIDRDPHQQTPHPYETSVQEHWAGAESWETPYRGQPVHEGDTPYPGGVSFEQERAEQRPGDGFEYLYGGGTAYSGSPPGPGGHESDEYDPGPPPPRKKSRKGLLVAVASSVLVLALIGGGVFWYVHTLPQPEEATTAYATAWEAQDYESLAAVTTGDDAAEILGGIDAGLGVDGIDVTVDTPTTEGGTGSASYEVTVSLTNADDWGWEGELPLVREDGEWWVDFSPEVAYPGLGEGQVLARTAVWGERGHILAADGTRLDGPDTAGSLQMIAGSLGEADEDDVERLGPAYNVGDTIGVEGLQRTYEEQLAGEAATTILMVEAEEAEDPASLEATEENTVVSLDGSDGEDVVTSIDMGVQNAAANAVIDSDDPVGLVAVRPSTGEILATANVPGGFNRAFEGQYPPGSVFKIISYSALLDHGLPIDGTMECPEEYELGGWPFRNAGNSEYGTQSVVEAFATSCNTALVSELGNRLSGEQLQTSAEQFGMNRSLEIGVNTHEPTFPPVDSATMLGAQGIGQGQVLTSPLHMATVPAAIADGSWRHPVLVTEPANEGLSDPVPVANAEALRPMMRAVITDGTAKDVGFEGEVFGKTGTAEYGTAEDAGDDDELPSHAWMVGYKGDVAFALVVDGGGGGSAVAGPLAAAFTNAL